MHSWTGYGFCSNADITHQLTLFGTQNFLFIPSMIEETYITLLSIAKINIIKQQKITKCPIKTGRIEKDERKKNQTDFPYLSTYN
jgi:hypothetical protein